MKNRPSVASAALLVVTVGLFGCAQPAAPLGPDEEAPFTAPDGMSAMMPAAGTKVGDLVGSTLCTTTVVLGLAQQIADRMACAPSSGFVHFSADAELIFVGTAILPYLDQAGLADLRAAAHAAGSIHITSIFRTVPQQYLLYQWKLAGRCGIAAAATPGKSNHESGRAVDAQDWSARTAVLGTHGWAHDVPGDDVHFDHTASPDQRGLDVFAFQQLWNENHPEDPIDEDGVYGPQTEARVKLSPADGFAVAGCS